MRKIIDGCEYISIGEVGELIGRSSTTIKRWYEWGKFYGYSFIRLKYGINLPIPIYINGTRYFRANTIDQLIHTRDLLKTGIAAEYFRRYRGKAGRLATANHFVKTSPDMLAVLPQLKQMCEEKELAYNEVIVHIYSKYCLNCSTMYKECVKFMEENK